MDNLFTAVLDQRRCLRQCLFRARQKKVYVFKMLVDGLGSGVDLVKRMQPRGDLENEWLMFDHVKRVQAWTTMACHVYDAMYYKVITIAVYDMQLEDTKVQCIM
jgi:hypothetical protein